MKPYYEHAGITIYHGDCREVLPQLECDLLVTDQPYGVGKDYGDYTTDDLPTFIDSMRFIAEFGKPAVAFVPVCRIYDIPVRPQWTGVWRKTYGTYGLIAYPIYPHWEALAFYNIKGDFAGNNGHRSDVFEYAPTRPEYGHPTEKPLDLMGELISFMPVRGTIADPFMGSGTTLRAAKNMNRRAIGIEIEERYCEIAAKRLSQEVFDFK